MDHAALILEFAAARRAMITDPGRAGLAAIEYRAARQRVADRYNAAVEALDRAAAAITAASPPP